MEETPYFIVLTAELPGMHRDQIDIELEDGVLTIQLPKEESARPRHIEVKVK